MKYLYKRGHSWYIRKRVPLDLRKKLRKSTIVTPLGTRDYNIAKARCAEMAREIEQMFELAREGKLTDCIPRVNWKIRPRHELVRRVYELETQVRELQERLRDYEK